MSTAQADGCHRGNLDWLDHPAFNCKHDDPGRKCENSLRAVAFYARRKHLPRHLAEYCFRFNHVLTSRACWLNWGMQCFGKSPPMPYRLLKLAEGHG